MTQTAPELADEPHTMIDDAPVPRASSLLLGGWLLGLLAAIGGAGTFGLFLGAFSKPHALFLLGSLVVRGAGRGDLIALFAAIAVVAMTVVMARGRRRR